MKCPKCRYLSFEPELRCKHCGYDFALAEPNLPARAFDELEQQNPDLPMVDLQLRATNAEARPTPALGLMRPRQESAPAPRRGAAAVALADRGGMPAARPAPTPLAARRAPVASPAPAPAPAAASVAVAVPASAFSPTLTPTPTDLPLFIKRGVPASEPPVAAPDDLDDPAMQVPAAPRPLVVRRRAPDSGRQARAAAAGAPALAINRADRDLLEYLRRVESEAVPAAFPIDASPASGPARARADAPARMPPPADVTPAAAPGDVTAVTRLKAAAVDVLVLAALNATVVWMALRLCDLGVRQLPDVPVLPLVSFLGGISLAYLLAFTVMGGQTIGKMVFGLRVVGDTEEPTGRQLSCRALLSVPSVLALGLGFLPALFGHEGRALHDRLTHTRVVRV